MPTKTITTRTRKPKQELAIQADIQAPEIKPEVLEQALTGQDLSGLKPENRIIYYMEVCKSLQLNHLTRPFLFVTIDGKTVMYATKDCTEQLRKRDGVTIKIAERKTEDGLHIVIARANTATREDESIGVEPMIEPEFVKEWNKQTQKKEWVTNPIKGKALSPADRAKAMMKAETKAKRRVTLSIAGLGIPDESEIESIITEDIPAVIEKQGEQANQIAEQTWKAADAKIIDAGGTVEKIEPAKAEVLPETPTEKKKDWRKVKCHYGRPAGQHLGKTLEEMNRHARAFLRDEWMPLQSAPSAKDKVLIQAIKDSIADGLEFTADAPQTPATPEKAETTTPEPTKSPRGTETGVAEPEKEKLEAKPMAWRSVEVCVENKKVFGKPLGDFEKDSATMRAIIRQLLPKITDKPETERTIKEKIFVNACRAMDEEMKPFDNPEFIANSDEETLRAEVMRRFATIGIMDEEAANKALMGSVFNEGESIAASTVAVMQYILKQWQTVLAALTEEK